MSQVVVLILGSIGSICGLVLVLAGTIWGSAIDWPLVSIGLALLIGNAVFAFLNWRHQRARDRRAQ